MKNRLLIYIFTGLLGIYLLSKVFSGKGERSFDTQFLMVDTSKVTSIVLRPKAESGLEFSLSRDGSDWMVSRDGFQKKATSNTVQSLLNEMADIQSKRIVSKDSEKFADYEVDEVSGSLVRAMAGDRILAEFIVGRFSFNQQTRSGLSFVRKQKDNNVYAVDGFLSMTFNQGFNSFRNKDVVRITPDDMTRLYFQRIDGNVTEFIRSGGSWIKGDIALDSAAVAGVINGYRFVSSSDFADDFDTVSASPDETLTISANNILEPITVHMYQVDSTYYIKSSQNPESVFSSTPDGIVHKLFFAIQELE